jgi:hypothetical protein
MLLDKYLPDYDVTEVHTIRIKASPEVVYKATMEVKTTEIAGMVRFLFWLRVLPEKQAVKQVTRLNNNKSLLQTLLDNGFTAIDTVPPKEFVFGLMAPGDIGRFWKKFAVKNIKLDAAQFMAFNNPDYIRVVANFLITPSDKPGWVILRTESRSVGLSKKAFKQFRPYWAIIRPWSGLIRRLWLSAIKRKAEHITSAAQ